MLLRALCATAALACSSAAPVPPDIQQHHYPQVKQIICIEGKGTGFRVGRNRFLSVAHVTGNSGCTIDGQPIIADNQAGDFSVIDGMPPRGGWLKINCDGLVPGQYVFATGYARGLPIQRTVRLQVTGSYSGEGYAILFGSPTVVPGMSGGPVFNSAGEVVGTVNMYSPFFPISLSRPLKGTSVCR